MWFQHSKDIWNDHPDLVAGVMYASGVSATGGSAVAVDGAVARFWSVARARLEGRTESELPEIQAWRRTFSRMGLKPTQYRCASEALLRRFKKEGSLPRIHPVIDLCNAISIAYAIPVGVLDVATLTSGIEVRYADGDERYVPFQGTSGGDIAGGAVEHPEPGEVIFADDDGMAHARRWTNRQSGYSAVRASTGTILVVAEALHASAGEDVRRLLGDVSAALAGIWSAVPVTAVLSQAAPRFDFS